MTNKVYAVSKGSYSDYSVVCVCPSLEIAEQAAARYNQLEGLKDYPDSYADKHRVEEFPWVTDPAKDVVGFTVYQVEIDANGQVMRQHEFSYTSPSPFHDEYYDVIGSYDSAGPVRRVGGIQIQGRSRHSYDVALKAARDKLAELKARDEGLE